MEAKALVTLFAPFGLSQVVSTKSTAGLQLGKDETPQRCTTSHSNLLAAATASEEVYKKEQSNSERALTAGELEERE